MIDKLLSLVGIHRAVNVVGIASNIIKAFEQDYGRDKDTKNAAIDALIGLLSSYKDSVESAPATPPVPPQG